MKNQVKLSLIAGVLATCLLILMYRGWLSDRSADARVGQAHKENPTQARRSHRIVSLHETITETVFALGAGHLLVGRNKSSYYPKAALQLPIVGSQHRLNAEGILRLRPTLVIGLEGVKPAAVLTQIRAAGLRVLLLKKPLDVRSSQSMIRALGQALSKEAKATQLVAQMDAKLAQLSRLRAAWKGPIPKVIALYVRGSRMRFVLGRKTSLGGMIDLIGAAHAVDFAQVKPVSAEAMIAARPDVVVSFSRGVESIGGKEKLAALPGLSLTPAGKQRRFVVMDDLYLGSFGPRTGAAALDLFRGVFRAPGTTSR